MTLDTSTDLVGELESYRRELTGFCYRMLGSYATAEDAVQDTFLKAFRAAHSFDGRSSLRTWLYRIARNVCIDEYRAAGRRARPTDLSAPARMTDLASGAVEIVPAETDWVLPAPTAALVDDAGDPAEVTVQRESIRLAFIAALQLLPESQRAAVILADVLHWPAAEVASMLDTTVAAVNSALQRARATLAANRESLPIPPATPERRELLARYIAAFEAYDTDAIVALVKPDVTITMPPFAFWLRGAREWAEFMHGPGAACLGSKTLPIDLNGELGFAQYKPTAPGVWTPWALVMIDLADDGLVAGVHNYVYGDLFERYGLPARITA